MKTIKRTITAAIAAVIAGASMISGVSASTYIDYYGNIYHDNVNDGLVYYMDRNNSIYAYDYQSNTYVGEDAFYGSIYYDSHCGYYAFNGGDSYTSLGWKFTLTKYYGTDYSGRYIYYNDDIGYFVINGNNYISYGFNSANIVW